MRRLICCFANYLTSKGVKRNDIIGIPMTNCIESVALIFAASALGAGLAPINPTVPAAAADLAFRSANVTHVIARKAFYRSAEKEWTDKTKGCRLCLTKRHRHGCLSCPLLFFCISDGFGVCPSE